MVNMEKMMTSEIGISDNVFSKDDNKYIIEYSETCPYKYGEIDMPGTPVCGMVHEVHPSEKIYRLFRKKIEDELCPSTRDLDMYRMYINCFSPADQPMYHQDGRTGITFIYYVNDEKWNLSDQGETQFYIDGMISGIPPVPNRMIMFHASRWHCATSFRDRYRFTIAVKYQPKKPMRSS